MNTLKQISQTDIDNLKVIKQSVDDLFMHIAISNDKSSTRVLEIAPQPNNSVSKHLKYAKVDTLDIDPNSNATYIADLCKVNKHIINDNSYDIVVCTEVLEHIVQPFDAVNELHRVLKSGGKIYISTPFNFRIHGPLLDCWRFTEHGLKELFKHFKNVKIDSVDSDRFLAPIHYKLTAEK